MASVRYVECADTIISGANRIPGGYVNAYLIDGDEGVTLVRSSPGLQAIRGTAGLNDQGAAAPAAVVTITGVRAIEDTMRQTTEDTADITAAQVERGGAGLPIGVRVVARHWHYHHSGCD